MFINVLKPELHLKWGHYWSYNCLIPIEKFDDFFLKFDLGFEIYIY